jgi:hypothetical protein
MFGRRWCTSERRRCTSERRSSTFRRPLAEEINQQFHGLVKLELHEGSRQKRVVKGVVSPEDRA